MPINDLVYFLWVMLGIRTSYILLYNINTYKKILLYKKENHNNFTDAQYYNLLFLAPSNEWCTIFSDLLFFTVEWRSLVSPCQEKKKKKRRVEEVSWKSLTWMMKHLWVHHCPWQSPKPKYASPYLHSASWHWQALSPTSFLFFSLKLLNSRKMNQSCSQRLYSQKKKRKKEKEKAVHYKD